MSDQKKQSIFSISIEKESIHLQKDVSVQINKEEWIYYFSFKISNTGKEEMHQVQLTEEFSPDDSLPIEQLTIDQLPQSEPLSADDIPLGSLPSNETREVTFQVRVPKYVDVFADGETTLTFSLNTEMHEIIIAEEGTFHLVKSPSCSCDSLRTCSCPDSSFEILSNEQFDSLLYDEDDWEDW